MGFVLGLSVVWRGLRSSGGILSDVVDVEGTRLAVLSSGQIVINDCTASLTLLIVPPAAETSLRQAMSPVCLL